MRAATVVQVLQHFEAPHTIAPRPPTTTLTHISTALWDQRKPTYSHIIVADLDHTRAHPYGQATYVPPKFKLGTDIMAQPALTHHCSAPFGGGNESEKTTHIVGGKVKAEIVSK